MIDTLFDGHAILDSAFILRNIEHTWNPMPAMRWGRLPGSRSMQVLAA
jgi:hypothetical protein